MRLRQILRRCGLQLPIGRAVRCRWMGRNPIHIPHVLHHRRGRPAPRAVHTLRPAALPADPPHVSIVVPTRDHVSLLRTCMAGLAATRYPAMDITIIDNGSTEPDTLAYLAELEASGIRISRQPGPFNYAAMHNQLVPDLRGPLLCLLNNDIEVIDPDWLAHMVPACSEGRHRRSRRAPALS